jgi:hypothetical protein
MKSSWYFRLRLSLLGVLSVLVAGFAGQASAARIHTARSHSTTHHTTHHAKRKHHGHPKRKTTAVTHPSAVSASAPFSGALTPHTTSTTSSTLLFDGGLQTSWLLNQSATPTRVATVADPTNPAATALQFTTLNSDIAPLTPTDNPRSQLVSPYVLRANQAYWESFEVYVPAGFPLVSTGWTSLNAAAYGAPWAGTPPAELSIENGDFRFQRNAYGAHPWQVAWSSPVVEGTWVRFTWHFLLSANGWIELYVNGKQVTLLNGTAKVSRLPIAMLDPTDSKGPWWSDLQLYYEHGIYPSASLLFQGFRIATTQAVAEA